MMASGASMRADLRPLLALLLPLLWNAVALADTVQCVAGGSAAAPLAWDDPATWSPAAVPDGSSDVLLDAACTVRCAAGECRAHTLKGTHAGAAIEIAPGATLALTGCEDADATNPSLYECGGENGFRFAPQGAVLHDSAADGERILRGASQPADPQRLRLALSAAIDVAPGDWFQVRGGPARNHVYRVVGADLAGCPADPAHCFFDVALHDPDMEFGRNAQTAAFPTGIGYVAPPAAVRIAATGVSTDVRDEAAHCVELCSQRVGVDCVASTTIAADGAYVGWTFGATGAALNPADPAEMKNRLLVVSSRNNVAETIGDGSGVVDRVCFADPVPAVWQPAEGAADTQGVFWPGYWPGDPWVLFRPATVRYAGAQGDGGLGFHGACVDSDFAYFDGWAKLSNNVGTPACQAPYQDTVVVAWSEGLPPFAFDQQAGCNGHSLDLWNFSALRGDRVALVDARTPVDTSATCDTGMQPWDGDPTSGTHGLSLVGSKFDPDFPPASWLFRYAGDDGVILDSSGVGPTTYTLRHWSWWYDMHGTSTEVLDTLASDPGQVVRIEDGRVAMWSGTTGCGAAINDPNRNLRFEIDGLLYVDPHLDGQVVGRGPSGGHAVRNLLAWGSSPNCAAVRRSHIRDSWVQGWNRLVDYEVTGVENVYFAAETSPYVGSIFGYLPPGASVSIHDFIATNLPPFGLIQPECGSGCNLTMSDGFGAWREPTLYGVANFYSTATVALAEPLEGLLFTNAGLLACSAGWGETGAQIGSNLLIDAPLTTGIDNAAACPAATAQVKGSSANYPNPIPFSLEVGGRTYGPLQRVGLSADQTLTADAGLDSSFAVPEPSATLLGAASLLALFARTRRGLRS
jgi:hypothetical protein